MLAPEYLDNSSGALRTTAVRLALAVTHVIHTSLTCDVGLRGHHLIAPHRMLLPSESGALGPSPRLRTTDEAYTR